MNVTPLDQHAKGRRDFWRQILGSGRSVVDELRGHAHRDLTRLPEWSDDALREIVPVYCGIDRHCLEDGAFLVRLPGASAYQVARMCDEREAFVLRRIGSGTNLADLAGELEQAFALPTGSGLGLCVWLFLDLVSDGLCRPASSHEPKS